MNIVITHTDFRLYWPTRIKTLNKLLQKNGHSLDVVEIAGKGSPYSFEKKTEKDKSLNWICLFPDRKMESISGKEAATALWDKLEEIKPDVVLAGAIAFPSGATATRWCRGKSKRIIIFDDARLRDVPRPWFVNFIKKRIYNSVDAILIPAKSHRNDFEFWGFPKNRIFFGLNVVDNKWFSDRIPDNKKKIRHELNLPKSFFLGVGRLIPIKNWKDVILAYHKACKEISTEMPALVIVGDGPEKDILKYIVKSKKIKNVILRSFVPQKSIALYYSLADFLVLASTGETWGLVVNEAMACKTPVLISNQCGCSESLVHQGQNGYTFEAGNIEEMASKMISFVRLPTDKKKQMGDYSKKIIDQWPLERFAQGAWEAIQYSLNNPRKKKNLLDYLITKMWKGRYRPT